MCWNGVLFACAEFTTHPTLNYASSECRAHTRAHIHPNFYFILFFICLRCWGESERNGLSDRRRIARAADKLYGEAARHQSNYSDDELHVQGHEWQHTARTRERLIHIRNFVSSSWVEREAGDRGEVVAPLLASPSFGPVLIVFLLAVSYSSIDVHTIQRSRLYKRPSSLQEPLRTNDAGRSVVITKQAATLSLSLCTFELLARQIISGEFNNQTLTLTHTKKTKWKVCVYAAPLYFILVCVSIRAQT